MKKILSERNIAGLLFVLVIGVFAFAHEDSKKRNNNYYTSIPGISQSRPTTSIAEVAGNLIPESSQQKSVGIK